MLLGTIARDWIHGLELVSLDYLRPVYNYLGLGIAQEETLRGIARDTLMGRLTDKQERFSIKKRKDAEEVMSVWITPMQALIKRAMGTRASLRLENWISYTACLDEHRNPWILYEEVILDWKRKNRLVASEDDAGISAPKIVLTAFGTISELVELEQILNESWRHPLSEWDRSVLENYGLQEIEAGSGFFPLAAETMLTIRMAWFQQRWATLPQILSDHDWELIANAARERAEQKGTPFVLPRHLALG